MAKEGVIGWAMDAIHATPVLNAALAIPVIGGPALSTSYIGMVLVFMYLWIPYMILPVQAALERVPVSLIEASRDLGATALATFRHVTFPLIWPAVVAAALLAFTLSVDEFIIAYFTAGAGQGSTTLPMQIYAMIRFGVTPEINAMATIILLMSFILVLLAQRFNRGSMPGTR